MPFIGIGLSTIIAVIFAIHVIRTGQDRYWLFILLFFPFLGSIIYFFAIFLPSLRQTRSAYQLESVLRKTLNPNKELKEAQQAFDISPTTNAHLGLAQALVNNNRAPEALAHYEQALSGVYKTAPDILLQYANALFTCGQYQKARETLDYLRARNPNYPSHEGHLLYTKILVELDDRVSAQTEFDALIGYYPSLEAASYYIQTLIRWGNQAKAIKQMQELDKRIKQMPPYAKRLNAYWIKAIKLLRSQLV